MGQLTLLTRDLDLSFNSLTGSIPSQLGRLTELSERLMLNDNSLTGYGKRDSCPLTSV